MHLPAASLMRQRPQVHERRIHDPLDGEPVGTGVVEVAAYVALGVDDDGPAALAPFLVNLALLLGRVTQMGETHLGLEVAGGVVVQIQRSAIVQVLPKGTLK